MHWLRCTDLPLGAGAVEYAPAAVLWNLPIRLIFDPEAAIVGLEKARIDGRRGQPDLSAWATQLIGCGRRRYEHTPSAGTSRHGGAGTDRGVGRVRNLGLYLPAGDAACRHANPTHQAAGSRRAGAPGDSRYAEAAGGADAGKSAQGITAKAVRRGLDSVKD